MPGCSVGQKVASNVVLSKYDGAVLVSSICLLWLTASAKAKREEG